MGRSAASPDRYCSPQSTYGCGTASVKAAGMNSTSSGAPRTKINLDSCNSTQFQSASSSLAISNTRERYFPFLSMQSVSTRTQSISISSPAMPAKLFERSSQLWLRTRGETSPGES